MTREFRCNSRLCPPLNRSALTKTKGQIFPAYVEEFKFAVGPKGQKPAAMLEKN